MIPTAKAQPLVDAPAGMRVVRTGVVDVPAASSSASSSAVSAEAVVRSASARIYAVNRPTNASARLKIASAIRGSAAIASGPETGSEAFGASGPALALGFTGLTAFQSEVANGGAPSEPPDQGLCVGHGKIFELVNIAVASYDTGGNLLTGPIALNTFFGVASTDFLSDPRCYYDSATDTFFFSVTDLGDFNPPTTISTSSTLLLVVMNGDGSNEVFYQLDTTDDGTDHTPSHKNCPCFEDQPLLGADANGVYLSGNEFPIDPNNPAFNGAQIYALNKADLIARAAQIDFSFGSAPIKVGGGLAASIQPSFSSGGVFASGDGGTEYMLSSLDFRGRGDHRIAVWALINSCGIPSSQGPAKCASTPRLLAKVIRSMPYGIPPNAQQESGNIPLGSSVGGTVESLDTDDDRMQQVMFANGNLYSALTTGLSVSGAPHAGILYFIVQPNAVKRKLKGKITQQGYVSESGMDFFYPSVAATNSGKAAMTFSFSGATSFPGAGYAELPASSATMPVVNTGASGAGPYDGESGYPAFGGAGDARWGDYSAAVADGGDIWMATEYVSGSCNSVEYGMDHTCGGARGAASNWGTLVSKLTP